MSLLGPLSISFAPQIRRSKALYRWVKPFADWYAHIAGYRQMGLKYDDLILEERDDVQKALGRLSSRQLADRVWRFRVASHASILHKNLPKDQWIKPEEDVRYLTPHIMEVEKEDKERAKWDTMIVERKK